MYHLNTSDQREVLCMFPYAPGQYHDVALEGGIPLNTY